MRTELLLCAALLPCMLIAQTEGGNCEMAGQLFTIDPLLNEILVKSPSGDIASLSFDQETTFVRLPVAANSAGRAERVELESIDSGDEICARPSTDPAKKQVSEVLVVKRQQIEGQQKLALAEWLTSGAFGTVVIAEPDSRMLVLHSESSSGATRDILVDAAKPAEIRRFLPTANYLTDRRPGRWEQIHVGDRVYVRGETFAGGASIRANQIWIGDFQAVAGTIDSIQPMEETVALHKPDAGQTISVHIKPASLFMIDPQVEPARQHLLTLDFSDLKAGDGVVVVGRFDSDSANMDALALITDFGRFQTSQKSSKPVVEWKLSSFDLEIP